MMTPEVVLEHLRRRLPRFEPIGIPELLPGGLLNHVWRVQGRPEPVIVKVAPPYIAAKPEIPLDPNRIIIEARGLAAFGPRGALAAIGGPAARPPRLLDFDERHHILVMEDVGQFPDLGTWLQQGPHQERSGKDVGQLLGQFIGALHLRSYKDQQLAEVFDNRTIQRTRLEVQYRAIRDLCEGADLPDADELGRQAIALGELLQQPGLCVIMGDLWPPSILVTADGLRLIDWELAHFGRPCQDVGHLAAHLWMYIHRAPTDGAAAQAHAALQGFLGAYRSALGLEFDALFGSQGIRESAVHLGAEVLVRAVGAFQDGYLYAGLGLDDPQVREAVEVAAEHIRSSESVDTFAPLTA
jgi:5-methylthioribose kinase